VVGGARLVDHVYQTQAECQPDSWAFPVALTDTMKGVLRKPSTIKGCQVPISCAEVELHELNGEKYGGHDLWCHT